MTPAAPEDAARVFIQMLTALEAILRKSSEAGAPAAVLHGRLAPDMFDLAQHVQLACGHAEDCIDRLNGEPASAEPFPAPASLDDLAAGVAHALARLLLRPRPSPAALEQPIEVTTTTGQVFDMTGRTMLSDWSLPQFYFHWVIAYGILRHEGVEIGIRDVLPHMGTYLRRA